MLSFAIPVVLIIIVLIVRLVRRKPSPGAYKLRDIGTIIDRSISIYRRHIGGLLLLSAACFFIGTSSSYNVSLFAMLSTLFPSAVRNDLFQTLNLANVVILVLSAFGIGSTILMCGAASRVYREQHHEAPNGKGFMPGHSRTAVAGLVLLMIIPSILNLFGWLGGLISLFWAVAPAVMVFEGLGPWAAVKRSFSLVRSHYSGLLNTIVPLWAIGWLVIGTPLFGGLWLLGRLGIIDSNIILILFVVAWLAGQVGVAPLLACGALSFYLYGRQQREAADLEVQIAALSEGREPVSSVVPR